MINEEIKVLPLPHIVGVASNDIRNEATRKLIENRLAIEATFKNDEFLKMDLTNGEIIGVKSTSTIDQGHGPEHVGDLPAFDFMIRHHAKYKNATLINLGNASMLFQESMGA